MGVINNVQEILNLSGETIDVCVALPTYDSADIIWLQLESLCRQKTQYNWELIICEEPTKKYFGEKGILPYVERLTESGCKRIVYINIKEHIPLSRKWVVIAKYSKGSSFLLTASDNYSPPNRIELTHTKLQDKFNWFDVGVGLFLHLFSFKKGTYKNLPHETGLFMGTKTSYIKRLKGPWPKKGIDAWIRGQMNIFPRYRHNKALLGLHTDGANKISITRKNQYLPKDAVSSHFNSPLQKIETIITDENIINRLKNDFYNVNFKLPVVRKISEKEKYKLRRYGKIK